MSLSIPAPHVMSNEETQNLRRACITNDFDAITTFFEDWKARGLDMNTCDWALDEAIQRGNDKLAILLIECGIPFSPFLVVIAGGQKLFEVLLAAIHHGWDINTPYSWAEPPALRFVLQDYQVTEWFLDHGASPNASGIYDDTPLSFAIREASIATIQLLFERGGDIQKGQLLIHAAWRKSADRLDVFQLLWDRGISRPAINKIKYQDNIQQYRLNKYSEIGTPLHDAVRVGNLDTIVWLVEHGANPLVKDPRGRTPLQLALDRNMVEIAEYLSSLSVVSDSSSVDDFLNSPGNRVESYEEGQESLLEHYKEHCPEQLYEQDGHFHILPIHWEPLKQVPEQM